MANSVSVGAVAGGDPAPGFVYGDSPARLMQPNLAEFNRRPV